MVCGLYYVNLCNVWYGFSNRFLWHVAIVAVFLLGMLMLTFPRRCLAMASQWNPPAFLRGRWRLPVVMRCFAWHSALPWHYHGTIMMIMPMAFPGGSWCPSHPCPVACQVTQVSAYLWSGLWSWGEFLEVSGGFWQLYHLPVACSPLVL